MENITLTYLTRAEIWLCISVLLYFLMNGAQIFETFVFVPKWGASPPENFNLLLDGRGVSLKVFWTIMHSIHEIAFILAIIFSWKIDFVRNCLLILFSIHLGVRIWTIAYFAPNVMDFQQIALHSSSTKELLSRISQWQTLNFIRVGIFIAISLGLIPVCIKLLGMRP